MVFFVTEWWQRNWHHYNLKSFVFHKRQVNTWWKWDTLIIWQYDSSWNIQIPAINMCWWICNDFSVICDMQVLFVTRKICVMTNRNSPSCSPSQVETGIGNFITAMHPGAVPKSCTGLSRNKINGCLGWWCYLWLCDDKFSSHQ